jgi:ribosome-binding ATPase YchF (GTP1/OBG family)
MQVGIIGLPKVGKTTLFNTLTASRQSTDRYQVSSDTNIGRASVPDSRLAKLRDHYQPKKFTPAAVTYVDIPGIRKGSGAESLDLARLREVDALAHVVRAFEDPEILHSEGSIDPDRDVEIIDLELILADMEIVTRRIERLEKNAKRGLSQDEKREIELLAEIVLPTLEAERPLRDLELAAQDRKRLRGFQLLSEKPLLLVINVDEADLAAGTEAGRFNAPSPEAGRFNTPSPKARGVNAPSLEAGHVNAPSPEGGRVDGSATSDKVRSRHREVVVVSAPIEEEISHLDAEHQAEFLADLGLEEPSLDRVIRASYRLLGLISFFTVGEDEVRAWTVRRDTPARQAGAAIHTDIERGFIRAEVTAWHDLLELGSLATCRDRGLLRLEGKEYPVQDGEIVHFRFNV